MCHLILQAFLVFVLIVRLNCSLIIFLLSVFRLFSVLLRLVVCVFLLTCLFFFFSSRRRHTRCLSDWSSDVCSSDLSASVIGAGSFRVRVALAKPSWINSSSSS